MNDLELRAALQRDADLVGEPAPDLLDRLAERRRHQRRQRVLAVAASAAVVVLAAALPVGASLLTRSDVGPAVQTTAPVPSVVPQDAAPPTPAAPTTVPAAPTVTTTRQSAPPSRAPATTSAAASTSAPASSSKAAAWPAAADPSPGGRYWSVVLAVSPSVDGSAAVEAAYADVTALGYPAGIGDLGCLGGAAEQLGLDPEVGYTAADVLFDTRAQAQQFVDRYEPGVVGTALVTAYCID